MSWTDERVEQLKAMWNDGKSASQIAKALGGVTRNAVIGKVHRLGLSNRNLGGSTAPAEDKPAPATTVDPPSPAVEPSDPPASQEDEPATAREAPPRPVPMSGPQPPAAPLSEVSAEALANLAEVEKKARKLSLMQLTERTCKWPIGDPATEEFWFCGLPAMAGKPYCEAHVAVAFQPMSSRRDRRAGSR
ncbi:MAG: GcrA cell cycle regulator [Alphaproteobacteria bacterium]|nr:MAG: GcrA cell cycle regulator [Alphaproteobacteria bacterium]